MAQANLKLDPTETRLAELGAPAPGAVWAGTARNAALARVRALCLPARRCR